MHLLCAYIYNSELCESLNISMESHGIASQCLPNTNSCFKKCFLEANIELFQIGNSLIVAHPGYLCYCGHLPLRDDKPDVTVLPGLNGQGLWLTCQCGSLKNYKLIITILLYIKKKRILRKSLGSALFPCPTVNQMHITLRFQKLCYKYYKAPPP